MTLLGVALAGAVGSILRYLVDHAVQRRAGSDLPLGTLVVNLSGSFALGVLVGAAGHLGLGTAWVAVLGTGLIGAYTTFSTFTFDTVRLLENGEWASVLTNLGVSLVAGVAVAGLGLGLGGLL